MLRLSLRALTMIGYQVTFALLQAGEHRVPQSRRRLFGTLPQFPRPSHVFPGGVSAPYRMVTVRDAISDLPPTDGRRRRNRSYRCDPLTSYQRLLRKDSPDVRNHCSREQQSLLNRKRIELVPTTPGSDWRSLPNTVVELGDGTMTRRLEYTHPDTTGRMRAVCSCADGESGCDPACRQEGTLIPWYLPHKATRYIVHHSTPVTFLD